MTVDRTVGPMDVDDKTVVPGCDEDSTVDVVPSVSGCVPSGVVVVTSGVVVVPSGAVVVPSVVVVVSVDV